MPASTPYVDLSRLYVAATDRLRGAVGTFLGSPDARRRTPFVIGLAGSVAVGRSTAARLLRELLARWPEHPRVMGVPRTKSGGW